MKVKTVSIIMLALVLFLSGCSGYRQLNSVDESNQAPTVFETESPFVDNAPYATHGSLWKQSRASLFAANKASTVGDILTVAIYEQASAKKEAATSTGRSASAALGIPKFFGIETSIANQNPNLDPSNLVSAESATDFRGSGSTSREEKLSATLTTQVVEVLRNGNFRVQGSKTVRVNNENQEIRLTGIVRPADISAYNIIDSKYILDAKIEYMGKGVISEKQRPGWLLRILDNAWPF
jgi:flagellar L-ring protein precursor FlgH